MSDEIKPELSPIVISEMLVQENKNLELLKKALQETLTKVFGEGEKAQKFIDVSRIPLICANLIAMHDNIKDIKEGVGKVNDDHEKRLRYIEKNVWKWIGVLVAVSVILTPVMTILVTWILSVLIKK